MGLCVFFAYLKLVEVKNMEKTMLETLEYNKIIESIEAFAICDEAKIRNR